MAKLLTKKEYKRRHLRYKIVAGIVDAIVVVACVALVLVCVQLVKGLIYWLNGDIDENFGLFSRVMGQVLHTNQ